MRGKPIKQFIVRRKYEITIVVLNLIIFHKWFFNFSLVTWGDWFPRMQSSSREMFSLPYIWSTAAPTTCFLPFGSVTSIPFLYPVQALEGLLARMGLGFPMIERLLNMWPLVIISALGSFYLLRKVFKAGLPAFVGSLVYSLNTYACLLKTGHLHMHMVYALAPLIILLFIKALEERSFFYAVITGLLCSLASFYDIRVFGIVAFVLVGYCAFYVFIIEKPSFSVVWKSGLLLLVPLGIVLLANMYWLLPVYKYTSAAVGGNPYLGRGIFGDKFANIGYAMTLHHPFWTGGTVTYFKNNTVPFYYFLIPVVAFSGLVRGRRNKKIVFFGAVSIIGILLTKQSGAPFPDLYSWLFKNVPFFNMFRESSKFFLLVALGYSVLIASFVATLTAPGKKRRTTPPYRYVIVGLIALLFLANAIPFISGSFGSLFVPKKTARDYEVFEDFLTGRKDYGRVLWVPCYTSWGAYTNTHPSSAGLGAMSSSWSEILETLQKDRSWSPRVQQRAIYEQPYFGELLANASVKYVVVPLKDEKNESGFFDIYGGDRDYFIETLEGVDFLKRIDIGTKDLVVFENTGFSPYFSSTGDMFDIHSLENLADKYRFMVGTLNERFSFVAGNRGYRGAVGDLLNIFENTLLKDIDRVNGTIRDATVADVGTHVYSVYRSRNPSVKQVVYRKAGNDLSLYGVADDHVSLNGGELDFPKEGAGRPLAVIRTVSGLDYWFASGMSYIVPIGPGAEGLLATLNSDQSAEVYSAVSGSDLIENGSFEDGFWEAKVGDYNDYDDRPIIAQRLVEREDGQGTALQLEAARHIAGTSRQDVPVKPGSLYLVSLDYRSPNSESAKYEISFNDRKGAPFKEVIPIVDDRWRTYRRIIRVPDGATSLDFSLHGLSRGGGERIITQYDNVSLLALTPVRHVEPDSETGFDTLTASMVEGRNAFSFYDPHFTYRNMVVNGSFEEGFWQEEVGDYHNYDDRPIIAQRLVERDGAGGTALQLEATRHIAGTSRKIPGIRGGGKYVLGLDYQCPGGVDAKLMVVFNDPAETTYDAVLPAGDGSWRRYSGSITAPEDASNAFLVLLCNSKDEKEKSITRFDNVDLAEIPEFSNWYYCLGQPRRALEKPGSITFANVNPTKKRIRVRGATTPFFLTMAETFDSGWKLMIDNGEVKGPLKSWLPVIAKPDLIDEKYHYKLDDVTNAWYVDTQQLARGNLVKRNANGTYDMDLVAEFWPQRYCYAGFVVSALTVLACIVYIVVRLILFSKRGSVEGREAE